MKKVVVISLKFLFFLCSYLVAMNQNIQDEQLILYIKNSSVSEEEKNYIHKKNSLIKESIERFLDRKIENHYKIPTVAFAFSGGGDRAMIAAAGCLLGAEHEDYFQIARYTAGVSGSTWWQAFIHLHNCMPSLCIKELKKCVKKSFFDPEALNYFRITEMLEKLHKESKIQFVDVWGALLVERLFGHLSKNPLEITFDKVRKKLELSQSLPFPIFSTVIPVEKGYQWGEINPWRGGSYYVEGFTSTLFFGSTFDNNCLIKKASEYCLSFFLGLFGSAYSISLYQCLPYISNTLLRDVLNDLFKKIPIIAEKHFAPAIIQNFMHDFKGPFKNFKEVSWVDAGHDINIAIPPLLHPERSVDIIIVCDASTDASVTEYPELCKAALWAKTHGRSFPDITNPFVIDGHIAYFCDSKNFHVPIVIYLANSIKDSTLKSDDDESFDQLCESFMYLAEKASKIVKYALNIKLNQLNKF